MHTPDHSDPWASLAESLGVGPGSETPPAAQPRPGTPAPRPVDRPKAKPSTPTSNWDDLATDLGIAPPAAEPPPRRTAEPSRAAAQPPRHAEHRPRPEAPSEAERGRERRRPPEGDGSIARDEFRDEVTARDDGAASGSEDEGGERRGRRRRGRRGGRRRRDRDGDSRPGDATAPRDRVDTDRRPEDSGRFDDEDAPREEGREREVTAEGEHAPAAEGGEDRPRRRRRGRRGGRGRSRGRDGGDVRGEAREPAGPAGEGAAALDEEPLPTSYGMRAPARPAEGRDQSGDGGRSRRRESAGESARSSRGRRRRRSGDDRQGGSGGKASGDADRSRRSRRGRDERSASSRVRRADFAPVAGAYDEDDEGLDFLGVEEASRDTGRRAASAVPDDVLAESGLADVRDVPSWVEAIGIVIAGNLDARNRGRGDGGRRDR